jgi:hypothetical protein
VALTPRPGTRSFSLRVVFYESNQARTTETRRYLDCKPSGTRSSSTPPVPPAEES